jgi:formate dehydrogenase major subunit
MKADRDANFVEKTDDGKTVNRWLTTGMLGGQQRSRLHHAQGVRSLGMLAFDNQARV